MGGKKIVSAVQDELQKCAAGIGGYDNYQYPNEGDSYSNDDTDDSPTEHVIGYAKRVAQ